MVNLAPPLLNALSNHSATPPLMTQFVNQDLLLVIVLMSMMHVLVDMNVLKVNTLMIPRKSLCVLNKNQERLENIVVVHTSCVNHTDAITISVQKIQLTIAHQTLNAKLINFVDVVVSGDLVESEDVLMTLVLSFIKYFSFFIKPLFLKFEN